MSWGVATQNGVSVSLASIVSLSCGATEFSPASLFTSGVAGAWYDPSDYSTLFQDSAGTTPVTAVEQPVGLMLDKSQGLVLGSELLTNGDFASGTTGWTIAAAGTAVVTSGIVRITSVSGRATISQALTTVVGQQYRVDLGSISNGNAGAGAAIIRITSTNSYSGTLITAVGSASSNGLLFFTATTTTTYIWLAENTATASNYVEFGGLSIKSDSGNHASQATAASRPVLRARYNQLTYSEQLSNAAWVGASTVSSGITYSGINIEKLTNAATNTSQLKRQTLTVSTATTFDVTAYASYVDAPYVVLFATDGVSNGLRKGFNVTSGTVGATQTIGSGWTLVTSSMTLVAPGIYRLLMRVTNASSTRFDAGAHSAVDTDNTIDSTISKSNYVGGLDVRVTNASTGSSAGTYQRIAAATDYDTAGFLPYLALDGTDDSFGTNSIDFSGADKMLICAGITKNSDAALAIVAELSASVSTNNGTFNLGAPYSPVSKRFDFISKGTVLAEAATTSTTYNAPYTGVISGIGDIAGDVCKLRINASEIVSISIDQGTGNYGNYPLYIGRRNNASLPFNGSIYQLIVCGKELSASELASTEAYVNSKTGAY